MTRIKSFRAIVYNQQKFKDLSRVVCPPYDVISPLAQHRYHENNPHNLIYLLLGKDIPGEDKYERAAGYFKKWLEDKILIQEDRPAIYFYSQQYNLKGEKKTRLGFICLLRLGDDKDSAVFAHEHTRSAPKEDRLKLLRQVKANLSPIFVIFSDQKRIIQRTFEQSVMNSPPFIDITDEEKTVHKLWRLDSPEFLSSMESRMLGENIFIADGHHRYEVACIYRQELKEKLGDSFSGEENFNYILAYFTNTDYRGLSILPIHRLLKLDAPLDDQEFFASLSDYFAVEEIKDKSKLFFLMEKGGRAEHVLGMYKDGRYWLLRLKNVKFLDTLIAEKPKEYRCLDVNTLNAIVLNKVLGYNFGNQDNLSFTPHAEELIEEANKNPLAIAFFLNPVKVQQIIDVALGGNKMPPKSTYFYPKVLSGLVINKLSEG